MVSTPLVIPVIDLADPSAAQAVRAAAHECGLFFVINHGVPAPLIASHFELARSFFALDVAEKREIDVRRSNCFRGYQAFGTQTIDAASRGDLKEGFIMGPDFAPDHPAVLAGAPNTGTNLWPRRPGDFRARMEAYVDAMNGLGRRLAGVIALSLALPADYFAAALREPLTYSQLLHYPALTATADAERLGAGAHTDWGMLTMLLLDDVDGLEVRGRDRTWRAATAVPGAYLVILGEMMLRLTDGRYRSATHRVRKNTSGRSRYSMPTFFDPAYDYRVACVPTCAPVDGSPRYPACSVDEHMREMARRTLSAQVS